MSLPGKKTMRRLRRGEAVLALLVMALAGVQPVSSGSMPTVGGDSDGFSLDVPLAIELFVDEDAILGGALVDVEIVIRAESDLEQFHLWSDVEGNAVIDAGGAVDRESLAAGEEIRLTVPVRFTAEGVSSLVVEADAVISHVQFPFSKKAALNVYLRADRAFAGTESPLQLMIRVVEEDLRTGRITQEEADALLQELRAVGGVWNQTPFIWQPPTPEQLQLMDGLKPDVGDSGPSGEPDDSRGSVTFRVMGTLEWLDENGTVHPVFGMTVEIRDDDLIGSELVTALVTDQNGQYDTGFISHDDGLGAGNPDIFVRFRTANSAIDVENQALDDK